VPESPDLTRLSHAEKDALIRALSARLDAANQRIAALEGRLNQPTRPPKTPANSSTPPSRGQKLDTPPRGPRPPRKGRPGVGRSLHPDPDRVVERKLAVCPNCQAAFPETTQTAWQVYDRIELPPVKPDVTRIRLFGGRCPGCGVCSTAPAPPGLEPGSPFGASVAAMVIYLHYAHAVGLERLSTLMAELFGLRLSEGAISNILARARPPLLATQAAIERVVVASPVICCDETSARVCGKNHWEWVFVAARAALHVIRPSRGKAVVRAVLGDARPEVWVSDMLGSQRGHAEAWQVCLAHLLRDAQYAIDCGDTAFSLPLRWLLLRAVAIGRRRAALKDATLAQYLYDLNRRLDRILATAAIGAEGRRLRRRILANRGHLFVFMTRRDGPTTNNVSERHLRPSVIFRKVTNGFRCDWGADAYAGFRSVVSTAKLHAAPVLDTLQHVLSARRPAVYFAGAG